MYLMLVDSVQSRHLYNGRHLFLYRPVYYLVAPFVVPYKRK